jgi:type II secretory pathway component PulF
MNFTKAKRFTLKLLKKNSSNKSGDLTILTDLLESEIDDHEIEKILGINLKDEHHLREILKQSSYGQYQRLSLETDTRKALLVVLHSMNLSKKIQTQVLKALSYPGFLFIFSLMMMVFVNIVLLPMFQSMLLFLGPKINLSFYQFIITFFILLDLLIISIVFIFMFILKSNAYRAYNFYKKFRPQNIWLRLITHQFCEKFLYFYRLGGSVDVIFKQIQLSSSVVLNYLCFNVLKDLENGYDLTHSILHINPQLQTYFKMNEEGIDITKYLQHYAKVQELIVFDQIKKYGKILLTYSYIKITFMIIILYQVMLKPIEMMEQVL